jgi:hypothetical protein
MGVAQVLVEGFERERFVSHAPSYSSPRMRQVMGITDTRFNAER